ncbi:LysR substrate-binding domain-containing protein [Pendulispora rubella]|uniref:LysR substrate-binding domain-containing protein n=1 Tax=Pendulispora rubella TaxID=2741070 RepID=A0ABZ2L9T5_9BACT
MMDREALWNMEVFLAIANGGTLAAAARALRVTPSAVSKQLAKLEARLGVRLLQRTTRTLRATAAGERYRAHARRVIEALESAEADVQSEETALAGPIRVSAPSLLGQEIVAPIVADFLKAHPRVRIDLELTDRFVDLVGEVFDLAIRVAAELPESGLTARRIGTLSWRYFASPAYVSARGMPTRPEDLTGHDCLELAHDERRGRWQIRLRKREVEVDVRGPLVSSSVVALHRVALAGLGIARLPTFLVERDLAAGQIVEVFPNAIPHRTSVFAVQPTRAFVAPRVRAFGNHLVTELPTRLSA